jgi:hypothetical protein
MTQQIQTLEQAILSGKKSAIVNGNKYLLPEPQRTGTETQKKAYAYFSAKKLLGIEK